ncbi:hypothetical protein HG536_0G04540 [Torulaspora globosa]|uniref:Uncharacterized protein n=1 Tax=Torulaspora globosa TaxID=48254 RepID=A0A7G3ZM56_9SACH|nr:uncharacterized protein HG536_0G04540 [Torulaspora globosa]QLL34592.1 hypothetical protein HG536_0G04540 [Torulaspora globosa]
MSDKNSSIFAPGHNRLETAIPETSYKATRVDPRELSVTPRPTEPAANPIPTPTHTLQADEPPSDRLEPAPITAVFDAKNQLASLIKNAKLNEEAIRARNDRIRHSKQQSKGRYGW